MLEHVWEAAQQAAFNSPLIPFVFLSGWLILILWLENRSKEKKIVE